MNRRQSRREAREHEARTHLTVISAHAQIVRRRLRSGTLDAPALDLALERIQAAVARLERLVAEWEHEGRSDAAAWGDRPES